MEKHQWQGNSRYYILGEMSDDAMQSQLVPNRQQVFTRNTVTRTIATEGNN